MELSLLKATWLSGLSAKKPNCYNQSFVENTKKQLDGSAGPLEEEEGNQSKTV